MRVQLCCEVYCFFRLCVLLLHKDALGRRRANVYLRRSKFAPWVFLPAERTWETERSDYWRRVISGRSLRRIESDFCLFPSFRVSLVTLQWENWYRVTYLDEAVVFRNQINVRSSSLQDLLSISTYAPVRLPTSAHRLSKVDGPWWILCVSPIGQEPKCVMLPGRRKSFVANRKKSNEHALVLLSWFIIGGYVQQQSSNRLRLQRLCAIK